MNDQRTATTRRAIAYLIAGLVLVALSCGLGVWVLSRGDAAFSVDVWWNVAVAELWSPVLTGFSQFMNWIGAGWFGVLVIPVGGALALIVLRRPWAAAFFLAAEAVSAGGVQVLKHAFGRVRPEDIIVISDYGSYPSGHVANAATLAVAAVVIFPRLWVVIAGALWVVLMAFSRTYLHAHWLSDTLGGALIGAGATLLVAAVFVVPMARETPGVVQKEASLG
jgi:membrane-associated phospholipid phosphatase